MNNVNNNEQKKRRGVQLHPLHPPRSAPEPVMQKARVAEPKTQCSFVDSHESSVGESVWWAWPQPFARCTD